MVIVGAGAAGLLASSVLRQHNPVVLEVQDSLPHNHAAVMRFRSDEISKFTGIPLREAEVRKAIKHGDEYLTHPRIDACNAYSRKVVGNLCERSVWHVTPDPVVRYIPPVDFVEKLSKGVDIRYGTGYELGKWEPPIVSTMPMQLLMEMVGWSDVPEFVHRPVYVARVEVVDTSVNQTIYYSDPDTRYYRATLSGKWFVVEGVRQLGEEDAKECMADFSISWQDVEGEVEYVRQKYGKLAPIDDELRREFIYTMTTEYGIYSLGRFGTWRNVLMDTLLDDLQFIEKLCRSRERSQHYHNTLRKARENGR